MAARTELKVAPREVLGKKVKALRREGYTPANIFGHHVESKAVQVPTEELAHTLKKLKRNEIIYLRLDGEEARRRSRHSAGPHLGGGAAHGGAVVHRG